MSAKYNRVNTGLDNVFSSRISLMRFEEDGSCMNLKMVAQLMLGGSSSNSRIDDITKTAGLYLTTLKLTGYIVAGPKEPRGTFTTGYVDNISHYSTMRRWTK